MRTVLGRRRIHLKYGKLNLLASDMPSLTGVGRLDRARRFPVRLRRRRDSYSRGWGYRGEGVGLESVPRSNDPRRYLVPASGKAAGTHEPILRKLEQGLSAVGSDGGNRLIPGLRPKSIGLHWSDVVRESCPQPAHLTVSVLAHCSVHPAPLTFGDWGRSPREIRK